MTQKGTPAYPLILPVGTQVVSRVEVKTSTGNVICLHGAVGAIVKSPKRSSQTARSNQFYVGKINWQK